MNSTVAEIVVDALVQAGAKRCYGIVGDTINHFTDAISRSDLRWIHVRHEEVAGFAAGGEAFMTGELAVCAGACGPGSLHFVNGLFESHRNGAPVVFVASEIDRPETGLAFPQDVDQRKIYEQHAVFCEYISHPSQARRITVQAAQAALNCGGVAVIIVNGDMFTETDADNLAWSVHRPRGVSIPSDGEIKLLAQALNDARSITLYAGFGARYAHDAVVEVASRLKSPIVHTSRAKEFIEPDNPYNIGMTGIIGNKAGLEAIERADVMLCLGTDFAWTQYYSEKAKIIQVDRDARHLGRRSPVHLGLVGDVQATLKALLPYLEMKVNNDHLTKSLTRWQEDQERYREVAIERSTELIHPQFVAQTLNTLAADDAIFTADGGSPMVWALRHLAANGRRRFLLSLLHGTMANAYPQALGIAAAYPHQSVVALCGDGGLAMLMGDLLTLNQEQLPVKILVFNNGSLGFVEMEQRVEGLLDNYTKLDNPDFSELARACGFPGWRVEHADDLAAAMSEWLAVDGPALLDVTVSRMELVMPPDVHAKQVASTALFGLKAVLDGRAREVLSLLRDNFLR